MAKGQKWYREYLKSNYWKLFKKGFYKIFKKICVKCDSKKSIQVHHKTYKRIGCEEYTDVVALCNKCHKKTHGIVRGDKVIRKNIVKNPPFSKKLKKMQAKGIAITPLHK